MIISKTPFRISLFGGGTDFPSFYKRHNGEVLSTTIDKYVYVIAKKRFDNNIRLGYSTTENVSNLNNLKHELAREAIKKVDVCGIEISTMADIPGGSGLGSSSAVTVGLLHILYAYKNKSISKDMLVKEAIDIEINKLHKHIGIQDQIAVTYGGFNQIKFTNQQPHFNVFTFCSQDIVEELEKNLLLFYTGNTRMATNILEEQNNNSEKNFNILIELLGLCKEAKYQLIKGNIEIIGTLLYESWKLKKQLASKITNNNIDELYNFLIKNGVSGGKLLGAGGGGFILAFCLPDKQKKLLEETKIKNIQNLPFKFEKGGSRIVFNDQ